MNKLMHPNHDLPLYVPKITQEQIDLLERLCQACAVSGDENEVRQIILEQVKPYADEVKVDALGNVLVTHHGKSDHCPRVMMTAHMDEVGFMLVNDEEGGLYRFALVGGIDPRQLVGKRVLVGREHLPGVIGAKPIHLTDAEERKHTIPVDALRIDLGTEGSSKVKKGDWATFATCFAQIGPSLCAKALDDRLGVATLIELVKHAPANLDLLVAFTVQEEIGLRGARVAGYAFNPDLAIVVDSTPANDLPTRDGSENASYNTRLGAGPAIYLADRATFSDQRLVRHLVQAAETESIPYQFRQPGGGGTDAGAIHTQRAGIPSVSVSVPCRYIHTAAGIARLDDWNNILRLLYAALLGFDASFKSNPS
jgi:tetrahedral aminopeptidase